ncbi:DUF2490 domain-containing protein [Flavobacterium sp.]|uniref:DUF2490 domain-containing protein n=1 Tax=Flavobacterium sp. TaxID=239 RepID=UPI00286CE498|nr:DUF2490 domain-containing protein [Flavobacterium sp.]
MINKSTIFFTFIFCFVCATLLSQNTRKNEANQIGWYNYFGTLKVNNKYSIHTEYQLRRTNYILDKQQGLLRVGVNYQLNPKVQFRLGYAWIETFPYGNTPLNGMGKNFTEHRIFQAVTIIDKISIIELSHRFMLEQRFIGRYSSVNLNTEDEFPMLNRIRYMFRMQLPLKGKSIVNNTPYLAIYDELFVGFGPNVNENIFDQNRIGVLLGYKINNNIRFEAGYLNQTLQLGREVNQQNIFQNNNGLIVNTILNF